MWKYIGFAGVLIILIVLLRPDLFFGSNRTVQVETNVDSAAMRKVKAADEDYTDPRRPSLIKKNQASQRVDEEGITMYAEGYSEEDFGDAFKEPEEMFQTSEPRGENAGGIWDILLELEFDISYDPAVDDLAMRPQFTDKIRQYHNKTIEIPGYIIPYDIVADAMGDRGDGTMFMLSAFPAATCFFCKGAGPESVMEVYPKEPIPYSKEPVRLRGRLELNEVDFLKMAYILKDAELIREK